MSTEKKEFKKALRLEEIKRHRKFKNIDVILKVSEHWFRVLAK